jgi:peptidoglycan biosynthesis protein MviN/MurJ (putative lipid II flippase)
VWVEFSGVLANLAGLLFLICTLPRFGIHAAAWNTVFYNCLKLAFLLPVLGRWQRPAWSSPTLREAWRLFKPFLPGQAYLRAEPLLDRFLASLGGAGSLSLLYVAQQIYTNVILVTSKAMVAPLAPRLAVEADSGAWLSFRRAYRVRLLLTALLSALGVSLLLAFGTQALRLAIGHAGVTAENVHTLWLVMVALAGAFAGGVSGQTAAGAFYAMGDTKTPTKVSVVIYTLYLPLKIAVFLSYGLVGLAVTMSTYCVINFIAQFALLEGAVSRRLSGPPAGSALPKQVTPAA